MGCARRVGTASPLASLALECVEKCSSDEQEILRLERQVLN